MSETQKETVIELATDFMIERVYSEVVKNNSVTKDEIRDSVRLHYEVFESVVKALDTLAVPVPPTPGKIDASNPDSVDLVGGPQGIKGQTFRG